MKKGAHYISDPAQLNELRSPVRQLIVDAFKMVRDPCSIKEIAERINRAPDSLYYHFRALQKVGLIVDAGTRPEDGKDVALYQAISKNPKIKYDFKIPGFGKLIRRIFDAAMRLTMRDFQQAVDLPNVRGESLTRNLYMCRMEAWLSKKDLSEINRRIDEIVEIMHKNSHPKRSERCAVFVALTPQEKREND